MSPYGDMFSSTNKSIPSLVGSKDSSTDSPMGILNSVMPLTPVMPVIPVGIPKSDSNKVF